MRHFLKTRFFLLLALAIAAPTAARAADPPRRPAAAAQAGPSTYIAAGPSQPAELARLRESIGKLPGIRKVEIRSDEDAITVSIDGDGASSQSMLVAAARKAGYRMRPARPRIFRAAGPVGEEDLLRLQAALREVPGVERVALSRLPGGAAVQVTGGAAHRALAAAGKNSGFTLQELTSYVASGPTAKPQLDRLRATLEKVPGVEQVEMRALVGGATLLVTGPANGDRLSEAGKTAGYIVWELGGAESGREFRAQGPAEPAARQRLTQALKEVDGVREVELHDGPEGLSVVVEGSLVRPPMVIAAAGRVGFTLAPSQKVTLPSVEPQANRNTPPDYDSRVLEDQATLGEPAPQFSLLAKDGVTPIRLSDYRNQRPVVLLFGSCT